jgi:HPt (histidine-containing phosphotransfer) domain-containing protein
LNRKIADRSNDAVAKASYKRDLALKEQALRQSQHVLEQLTQAIADIDSELAPLDQELGLIRQRKLEV